MESVIAEINNTLIEPHIKSLDSIAIRYQIDSIFNKTAAINPELIKFSLAGPYIHTYIRYHGDKRKMETHDKAIFGPYIDNFCAPESLQPYLLGSAAICQIVFNTEEMNIYKVKDYLNEKMRWRIHFKFFVTFGRFMF